jgi:uncharacterized coiled-coil DUF342 family protein
MPSTAEVIARVNDLESRVSVLERDCISHRHIQQVHVRLDEHGANLSTLNRTVLEMSNHLTTRIDNVHKKIDDVRTEMRTEFADVRTEMRTEFTNVRTEMRAEFGNVREDMSALRDELRGELRDGLKAILTRLPPPPGDSEKDGKPGT